MTEIEKIDEEIQRLNDRKAELERIESGKNRNRKNYNEFLSISGFNQDTNDDLLDEFQDFFIGHGLPGDCGRDYDIDQIRMAKNVTKTNKIQEKGELTMGREVKRVPMDFDAPIDEIWKGYCPDIETFQKLFGKKYPFLMGYTNLGDICDNCSVNAGECSEFADYCFWYNETNKAQWFKEVPTGDGFQLWETTTEGSPQSPVFKSLEELAEWCEGNATVFADMKASKKEWLDMFKKDFIHYTDGNVTFV